MSLVIRNAQPEDVEEMIAIEHICFPPAEAADAQSICERYAAFPENFFVAELDGSVVGFVNGCTTDEPTLPDELYHDVSLHKPYGAYQTVFGLDVLPAYRNQGIAAQLLQRMIDEARARECLGVVLTCKDHLKHYYEKFGFIYRGVSNSTHGGAKWNDMLLNF